MTDFIKFIEIDNIDEIKNELKNLSFTFLKKSKDAYSALIPKDIIKDKIPALENWLRGLSVYPFSLKFYFTPPGAELAPHMDGSNATPINWGINIPVINYEKGKTFFYDCDESNIDSEKEFNKFNQRLFRRPLDKDKLRLVKTYVVDKPCAISTNVMHSATNYGDSTRVILLIRWPLKVKSYKEIL
tara:strand:+ start:313 stop:870 length:558 start_codon:yes stop_codon:yes gene_type:complete